MWNIDQLNDNIYLSGAIEDYNRLTELGITTVINLRAEQHDDVWELTKRGISYFWIPMADGAAPRSDQIRAFLELSDGVYFKILVHCTAGKGRTGFMAAAYLLNKNPSLSIQEAIKYTIERRPVVDLTEPQLKKLMIHFPGRSR